LTILPPSRTGSDTSRMSRRQVSEPRAGIELTNLDQPLFDGSAVTKRDLVDYLDAVADRILQVLRDRPLSVVRVRPGQPPFMQKNLPRYAPDWVERTTIWAQASRREVSYPLCQDRRTLLWLANQRAVEYHPTLSRGAHGNVDHVIIDLDPPEGAGFGQVVRAAWSVRQALADAGLSGAVKTSGAKGLHVVVPLDGRTSTEDAAAATRALAVRAARLDPEVATTEYVRADRGGKVFLDPTRVGGATLVAAYSPRVRPDVPVSFPVSWDDLDRIAPADFTVRSAPALLGDRDPWQQQMPVPQALPPDLVEEGHRIPVARVAAMHEGKRRAAVRRAAQEPASHPDA
ncbi:MAG TPA: non-homologous end-joining DNA ligase, partial [Kineosporiaceae bacterium]|nr:non-homologous end-joining DNA ligase [Kineosporiaceae bacterium]